MIKYIVKIEEKIIKEVEIEAKTLSEAKRKAYSNYENMETDYVTTYEDFVGSKISVRKSDYQD